VKDVVLAAYSPTVLDRHRLCAQFDSTLFPVGASIEVQKDTNLRATPGGGVLAVVPKEQILTILDFELRNEPNNDSSNSEVDNDRYYKVNFQGKEGYLYAGNKTDYRSWMVLNTTSTIPSSLAKIGESIKVLNAQGVNLRTTPGGTLLRLIPKSTELQVLEVFIEGANNKIYYKVSYQGQEGYVYTGLLVPTDTTGEWTQVLR
jgi:hypothetical protein